MRSEVVDRLAWTLVHSLWEGAAVAGLFAIALGFAYRSSARVRYAIGCVALLLLFVLPLATYAALGSAGYAVSAGTSSSTMEVRGGGLPPDTSLSASDGYLRLLVGAWLFGVVILTLRLFGAVVHIERWRRQCAGTADEELAQRVQRLARGLGFERAVSVLVSDEAVVPSAWGILRPVLLLPASLVTGLPAVQLESILLHELAHIRRFDFVVNLLQTFVETVLFYHPAAWAISSFVRREREHCCDDIVVAALGDPLPYARALLQLEERRHVLPHPALSARGGTLMTRIQRILARPAAPSRLFPTASAIATLGLVAALIGGTLQAQAHSPQTAPRKETPPPARQVSRQGETVTIERRSAPPGRSKKARYEIELRTGGAKRGEGNTWIIKRMVDGKAVTERVVAAQSKLPRRNSLRKGGSFWPLMGSGDPIVLPPSIEMPDLSRVPRRIQLRQGKGMPEGVQIPSTIELPDLSDLPARIPLTREGKALREQRFVRIAPSGQWRAMVPPTPPVRFHGQGLALPKGFKSSQGFAASKSFERAAKAFSQANGFDAFVQAPAVKGAPRFRTLAPVPMRKGSELVKPQVFESRSPRVERERVALAQGAPGAERPAMLPPTLAPARLVEEELKVTADGSGEVSVDAKNASLATVLRLLAQRAGQSIVIQKGTYDDVTAILANKKFEDALRILCRAGGATYRVEDGVYVVLPRE